MMVHRKLWTCLRARQPLVTGRHSYTIPPVSRVSECLSEACQDSHYSMTPAVPGQVLPH